MKEKRREFLRTMEDGLRYNPLFAPFTMLEYNFDLLWNGSWKEWIRKGWSTVLGIFLFTGWNIFYFHIFTQSIPEVFRMLWQVGLTIYAVIVVLSFLWRHGWKFLEHFIKICSGVHFAELLLLALVLFGLLVTYAWIYALSILKIVFLKE